MALPTSPSVVVLEKDTSIYTPNTDSSVVGIVGFADKGPVDEATLITSQTQLINTFGKPKTEIPGQGLEGALEILEATNQLYFVRAANASATEASAAIKVGFSPSINTNFNGLINENTSWAFLKSLITNLTGVRFNYFLTDELYNPSNSATYFSGDVNLDLNYQTVGESILAAFNSEAVNGDLFATFAEDGKLYIVGKTAGYKAYLALTTILIIDDGSSTDAPSNGEAIQLEVDGQTFNASSIFYFSSVDHNGVSRNTTQFIANDLGGELDAEIDFGTVSSWGGTGWINSGASSIHLKVASKYPGSDYSLKTKSDGSIVGLSVEVDHDAVNHGVTINENGALAEKFNVKLSQLENASITTELLDSDLVTVSLVVSGGTEIDFPEYNYNTLSNAAVFNYTTTGGVGTSGFASPRFIKSLQGIYPLAGGDSGYSTTESGSADDFTALIGTGSAKTGMHALDDDSLNISIAAVPGINAQSVQNALITLAETSKNFVAVVSPPYGLGTVQEAVNWMNGKETRTAAINNSYAAVYWPWVQTFNYFAGADEWYDPSIFAVRQMVYTDSVAEPWFAPAGYRRGRLTKPSAVEVILNQGDRDALYVNNINPITNEPLAGITVFGQKTAQRVPSALDRVNVRRLMIYIRKVLLILGKPFQFEPNDEFTWVEVEAAIAPFIDDLKARRAIVEGDVICDATTNTPLRVDRNELWCSIAIKPTKAAETIVFEVNLTSQSATING